MQGCSFRTDAAAKSYHRNTVLPFRDSRSQAAPVLTPDPYSTETVSLIFWNPCGAPWIIWTAGGVAPLRIWKSADSFLSLCPWSRLLWASSPTIAPASFIRNIWSFTPDRMHSTWLSPQSWRFPAGPAPGKSPDRISPSLSGTISGLSGLWPTDMRKCRSGAVTEAPQAYSPWRIMYTVRQCIPVNANNGKNNS